MGKQKKFLVELIDTRNVILAYRSLLCEFIVEGSMRRRKMEVESLMSTVVEDTGLGIGLHSDLKVVQDTEAVEEAVVEKRDKRSEKSLV